MYLARTSQLLVLNQVRSLNSLPQRVSLSAQGGGCHKRGRRRGEKASRGGRQLLEEVEGCEGIGGVTGCG